MTRPRCRLPVSESRAANQAGITSTRTRGYRNQLAPRLARITWSPWKRCESSESLALRRPKSDVAGEGVPSGIALSD